MEAEVTRTIDQLEARCAQLEQALAFYADPENYQERGTGTPNGHGLYESTECPIWDDNGEIARAALAAHPTPADSQPKEEA